MPKAVCPRLTFEIHRKSDVDLELLEMTGAMIIYAKAVDPVTGKKIEAGRISLAEKKDRRGPYVAWAKANAPFERCGVGTALYEKAAKIACAEFKAPLQSDIERSAAAHAFWKKQEAKGRARCIRQIPVRKDDGERGAVTGRDGCERYELTCPAPKDLGRVRSPKRR